MCRPSHSLAPRIDSGSDGATTSQASVRLPAMDSTEARNHASYSHFARTASIRRSGRALRARARRAGPRRAGHAPLASSRIRMPPPTPTRERRDRRILPAPLLFTNLDRRTRMGFRMAGGVTGASSCTMRRSNSRRRCSRGTPRIAPHNRHRRSIRCRMQYQPSVSANRKSTRMPKWLRCATPLVANLREAAALALARDPPRFARLSRESQRVQKLLLPTPLRPTTMANRASATSHATIHLKSRDAMRAIIISHPTS